MKFIDSFIDVTKYAKKLPTSEYLDSGKYPIIDQGQKQIAGYTDIEEGLFTDVPAIIFGDHTRVIKYIDTPFFIGADGVKVIKCLDGGTDYKYCYYLLKSARIPDTGYNRHFKWLKESVFPEHNKQQQKQIVDTLTATDKLMCKYNVEANKLDMLIKSRFSEMFGRIKINDKGWNIVALKRIADIRGRVGWKGYKKEDLRESGPIVLGATHLTDNGDLDLSAPVHLSREKYEESPEIVLQKNDLIFTQRGNTIGKVGLVAEDIGEATINPCVLIIRPLNVNPIYLKTYFIIDDTKDDMWILNSGSAQPMITQKGIGEYHLILPPIALQNQFADFVTKVDQQKSTVQKSIDKLETLKKSLMQEYFG